MQFLKIRFSNYRCFLDGELDFTLPPNTPPERNIILFSAENGGGKTQLMFAFRFALYGLDERDFREIQGQAATPYALNQNVYTALAASEPGKSEDASVTLSFKYDNETYTIKRTHTFRRTASGVAGPLERVILKIQTPQGDTTPYTEPNLVRARINQIIPEQTLYAILCDGERVRLLGATGQEANNAIEAVIRRMMEHDLLEAAKNGIRKVMRAVQKQISNNNRNSDSAIDENAADALEREIEDLSSKINAGENNIARARERMNAISVDLKEIESVREKEQKREGLNEKIREYESERAVWEKKFIESLNDQGYWGIADSLCKCVSDLLKDVSLRFPGLQSDVVETIMKRDACICGRPIDETIRKILQELMLRLPPVNIDAVLSAVLQQYGQDDFRNHKRKEIAERIGELEKKRKEINNAQALITSISGEIEASKNPNAQLLEEENQQCNRLVLEETANVAAWKVEKKRAEEKQTELTERVQKAAARAENGQELSLRYNLLCGAETGIKLIASFRVNSALHRINHFLSEAFTHLRSQADSFRQAYITVFQDQHRLVVYHYPSVDAAYSEMVKTDMNEDQKNRLREGLILENEIGNSMGQLKTVSLAFMKAILDYVKERAANDRYLNDATYPIVLDAPFGDIKRENLDNAINYLHEFSDQVILLIADEQIPPGIKQYVAKTYSVFRKHDPQQPAEHSVISLNQ